MLPERFNVIERDQQLVDLMRFKLQSNKNSKQFWLRILAVLKTIKVYCRWIN